MELSIDKFGRVVLPKRLREHLGARAGLTVEVNETAEGILLKPVRRASGLIRKDGILIHGGLGGKSESRVSWDTLVDDEREERIRHIAGT